MRNALLIAATDLRRRLRNRSFVLQAFVGPLLLATIISTAFGGGLASEVEVGIVAGDGSQLGSQIADGLAAADVEGVVFQRVIDEAAARAIVDDGSLGAAVVIPDGFSASLSEPTPIAIEVISDPENPIASAVAHGVARRVAARANAARLAVVASARAGAALPDVEQVTTGAGLPIEVLLRSPGDEASPAAHFGPGMGLLFLLLSIGAVARGLIEEQRRRVLDRIRAAPIRVPAVLLGKCVAVVLVSILSLVVIWAATTALLGAAWGDAAGVLALIVASALAVAGVAGVVASIARTEQSADTLATMAAFALTLVGGGMIPLADMPEAMQRLSLLTPNGWALRGFAELSAGGGALGDVSLHLVVLVGWAVALGAVAAVALPRRLGAR